METNSSACQEGCQKCFFNFIFLHPSVMLEALRNAKHCREYKDENTNHIFNELIILCNRVIDFKLEKILKDIQPSSSPLWDFNIFYDIPIEWSTRFHMLDENPCLQLIVASTWLTTHSRQEPRASFDPLSLRPVYSGSPCAASSTYHCFSKHCGLPTVLPQPLFRLNYLPLGLFQLLPNKFPSLRSLLPPIYPTSCHQSFFLRQI